MSQITRYIPPARPPVRLVRFKPRPHWRQSWKEVEHSGDNVDRGYSVDHARQADEFKLPKPVTKSTVSATKSTVYGDSLLCCRFVSGFCNSRLWKKSSVLNSTLSLYGALHRQSVVTIVLEMIRYVCDGAEMHESNFRLVLNKRCDHETDNYCYDAPATISEAYSDCSCLSVLYGLPTQKLLKVVKKSL